MQIRLDQFARKGLNSDIAPSMLDGDYFTHAENIRIYDGAIHPFGGHIEVDDIPGSDRVGKVVYVPSKSGKYMILLGSSSIVHYDGAFTDKSPTDYPGVGDVDLWTSTMIGEIPVINHPDVGPLYYDQSVGEYKSLPWDATQKWDETDHTCTIIRSHKQFMFALGVSDSGVEKPDAIRWSAPADVGSVPPTWDELDVTSTAGIATLGGSGGPAVDGLTLRDSFVVYRERSISIFEYVSGSSYVWRIRHLSESAGLLSRECIVEANGAHYFIGNGDIYRNDGTSIRSIMHNRLRNQFALNLSPDHYKRSYAIHYITKSEIWFCVPNGDAEYANTAYIYNYLDNTWAIRDVPESTNAVYGTPPINEKRWDDLGVDWDSFTQPWNEQESSPYSNSILSVTTGTPQKLTVLDAPISLNVQPYSSIIERTEFALEGVNTVTTINKIYPHVTGVGKLFIQFGSQQNPGGTTTWKAAVEFDPTKDSKIDLRSTGLLHCYRIYADDVKVDYAFTGMTIEYVTAGAR